MMVDEEKIRAIAENVVSEALCKAFNLKPADDDGIFRANDWRKPADAWKDLGLENVNQLYHLIRSEQLRSGSGMEVRQLNKSQSKPSYQINMKRAYKRLEEL